MSNLSEKKAYESCPRCGNSLAWNTIGGGPGQVDWPSASCGSCGWSSWPDDGGQEEWNRWTAKTMKMGEVMAPYYSLVGGAVEFELTIDDALSVSGPGDATSNVDALMRVPYVREQLDKIDPEELRRELEGYGAWGEEELADHEENLRRFVWVAGNNIVELEEGYGYEASRKTAYSKRAEKVKGPGNRHPNSGWRHNETWEEDAIGGQWGDEAEGKGYTSYYDKDDQEIETSYYPVRADDGSYGVELRSIQRTKGKEDDDISYDYGSPYAYDSLEKAQEEARRRGLEDESGKFGAKTAYESCPRCGDPLVWSSVGGAPTASCGACGWRVAKRSDVSSLPGTGYKFNKGDMVQTWSGSLAIVLEKLPTIDGSEGYSVKLVNGGHVFYKADELFPVKGARHSGKRVSGEVGADSPGDSDWDGQQLRGHLSEVHGVSGIETDSRFLHDEELRAAHQKEHTKTASLNKTGTNWTLDGLPIEGGFDVVSSDDGPDWFDQHLRAELEPPIW